MTREEVAKIVHSMPQGMDAHDYLVELVNRAVEIERDACIDACWHISAKYHQIHHPDAESIADECAGAIRARGEK
jgi:hypothetical protein